MRFLMDQEERIEVSGCLEMLDIKVKSKLGNGVDLCVVKSSSLGEGHYLVAPTLKEDEISYLEMDRLNKRGFPVQKYRGVDGLVFEIKVEDKCFYLGEIRSFDNDALPSGVVSL